MVKDFDDFIRWYADSPDKNERAQKLAANLIIAGENLVSEAPGGDPGAVLSAVVDDIVLNRLRAYHEWANQ